MMILVLGVPIYCVLRLKPDHLLLCLVGLWLLIETLTVLESPRLAPSWWEFLLNGLFYVLLWFGVSIAKDVAVAAFQRGRRTESDDEDYD